MPTVRWEPRAKAQRFHYRSLERFDMSEMLSDLDLFMLSQLIVRKNRAKQGKLTARKRITNVVILACTVLATMSILDDINLKRETVFYPPADSPTYGVESTYWQNHLALFFSRYRFRQPDLLRAMQAMELYGKEIKVGRKGRHVFYPAEVCLLVMLRRLAYPCRFSDLVQEFGIPSNRLCEIFHCMVDIIFEKYRRGAACACAAEPRALIKPGRGCGYADRYRLEATLAKCNTCQLMHAPPHLRAAARIRAARALIRSRYPGGRRRRASQRAIGITPIQLRARIGFCSEPLGSRPFN